MAVTIETLQVKSRTQHHTDSGMDIEQVYYVEPYEAFPDVLDALLGSVKDGKITFPAADMWVKTDLDVPACYCNEARVDMTDPLAGASIETDLLSVDGTLRTKLESKIGIIEGAPGAYITAHFRPLVRAWDYETPLQWKWVDPVIKTGLRQLPWPDGLFICETSAGVIHTDPVAAEVASPFEIQVSDVSIRQMFVETIPTDLLGFMSGAVNLNVFPDQNSAAAHHLPAFPRHTLKYISTDVRNMMDSKGNRWFELTHNFQWVRHYADRLIDIEGNESEGWVTWNHIFTHPSTFGLSGKTGWYEVWRGQQRPLGLGGAVWPIQFGFYNAVFGRLYKAVDFMALFQ